jgi:hypothetical protein
LYAIECRTAPPENQIEGEQEFMTIHSRELHQQEISERRRLEAAARPNVEHRALVFLLKEAVRNNRDIGPDAAWHIQNLDEAMKTDSEALAQLENPAPAADPAAPDDKDTAAGAGRTSSRFSKRT